MSDLHVRPLVNRYSTRAVSLLLISMLCAMTLSGCTIIRYVENNKPDPPDPEPPEPKVVDMLVLVELDRSVTSLADAYNTIILELVGAMALSNVNAERIAVAPLYRRTGESVPLIYGEGDEDPEFASYAEAIAFFANDDGQTYLRTTIDADGENLAALGLELDTRAIYHPTTADPTASSYFGAPKDGFVVVTLSARRRPCGIDDAACKIDGVSAPEYFTKEQDGKLTWLELGDGKSLSKKRVFHVVVATDEGVSDEAFVNRCESMPGFPAAKLDFMEPSSVGYYKPLVSGINERGGKAELVDLCTAMSPIQREAKLKSVAGKIAGMF